MALSPSRNPSSSQAAIDGYRKGSAHPTGCKRGAVQPRRIGLIRLRVLQWMGIASVLARCAMADE